MFNNENLTYSVLGFGRKKLIGVLGMGSSVGASLVCRVFESEVKKRGLSNRVHVIDNPTNYLEMDYIILVIDPLPSKIRENLEIYAELRKYYDGEKTGRDLKVYFLLNKMNDGVDKRELERFLKHNFIYIQNLIPLERIYETEYMDLPIENSFQFNGIYSLCDEVLKN